MPIEISGGPFPPDRQDALAAVLARVPGIEPEEAALLAVVTPCVVTVADEESLVDDLFAAGFEARHIEDPFSAEPAGVDARRAALPAASNDRARVGIWLAIAALALVGAGLVGVGIGSRQAEPEPIVSDIPPGSSPTSDAKPEPLAAEYVSVIPTAPRDEAGTWTTRSMVRASETGRPATLLDVRTGRHDGYDRVVFEFDGEALPRVEVEYGGSQAECMTGDTSNRPDHRLDVRISNSRTLSPDAYDVYDPTILRPRLPSVYELRLTCDGSLGVWWSVTTAARPYRTLVLRNPLRFILDVQSGV